MFFNLKNKMYTRLLQDLSTRSYLALVLIVALLAWSLALPAILKADHDVISPGPLDLQIILSDSAPGITATHTISFKIAAGTEATLDDQVTITYHEAGASASSTSVNSNFDASSVEGGDVNINVDGTGVITFNALDSDGTNLVFDITTPLGAEAVVTIVVPGIVNPTYEFDGGNPLWATTHEVTFGITGGGETYSNKTRVAIIDAVTMTAAIDTIFEFSVAGLAGGTAINGIETTYASTPTSLDFQTLTAGVDKLLGHELQVATNASNGFIVTIQETQELTSSLGEKIHRFQDTLSGEEGQTTPIGWLSPASTLDQYQTYGHYGITTTDGRLDEVTVAGDAAFTETADGGYIGNFHQEPRVIFGHTGPTNAGTEDTGLALVGVRIEISSLQPAGDDYTNTLVYVATPTF